MSRILRIRSWLGLVVVAVALFVALGATSLAARDGGAKKTAAVFYSPSDYDPSDSSVTYSHTRIGQVLCKSTTSAEGIGDLWMPLEVPDGATITKVTFFYFDRDPSGEIGFSLGFSEVGLSDDAGIPHVTSEQGHYFGTFSSGDIWSVDILPTPAVTVDAASRRWFVDAQFRPCDGNENRYVDGVRVEYLPR